MIRPNECRWFTRVDLLAVVILIVVLISLLLPAIQSARESARQAGCKDRQRQIGLGLMQYYDKFNKFPASCESKIPPGATKPVNGWSFWVPIVPYLELNTVYSQLNREGGVALSYPDDPNALRQLDIAAVGNTRLGIGQCPSFRGPAFFSPATKGALTTYKAIGATHAGSLNRAWDPKAKTLYEPDGGTHPDGGLPPVEGLQMRDFRDGLSNTAIVCETTEETYSRWIRGDECVAVGFPERSGDAATSFVRPAEEKYYAPAGFQPGRYDKESTVTVRSYVAWDYGEPELGHDGTYGATVGAIPTFPATAMTLRGIGSDHPKVINHLFADGAVRSVSKNVDFGLYFFILTRSGGDPGSEYFSYYH